MKDFEETLQWLLNHEKSFRYMMLGRMKADLDCYSGAGRLWAKDAMEQIEYMKGLYNSFANQDKPEWITWNQIIELETNLGA